MRIGYISGVLAHGRRIIVLANGADAQAEATRPDWRGRCMRLVAGQNLARLLRRNGLCLRRCWRRGPNKDRHWHIQSRTREGRIKAARGRCATQQRDNAWNLRICGIEWHDGTALPHKS